MKRFHDDEKRPWDIRLSIDAVKRVKAATGFDLLEPALDEHGQRIPPEKARETPNLGMVLESDLLKFYDVLWAIIEPEAAKSGVAEESFGRALAADCLVEAQAAFLEEWQDFFVQLRRPANAKLIAGNRDLMQKIQALATAKIEAFDLAAAAEKAGREMDRAMAALSGQSEETGPSSTSLPDFSA